MMSQWTRWRLGMPGIIMMLILWGAGPVQAGDSPYPWQVDYDSTQSIYARVPVPEGCRRVAVESGSFAAWLRGLPLKPGHPQVMSYRGRPIAFQRGHWGVIDIDVGDRDLQQCADAIIRLRAEYLFNKKSYDSIHFTFTNGDTARYTRWSAGYRPAVHGSRVDWIKRSGRDTTYAGFRKYLDVVFTYAGTQSLAGEMRPVTDPIDIRIGDVFVIPGSPGHAVIIVDMAAHNETGQKLLLLAQGYMPAQDMHIVRNPADSVLSPWHEWNPRKILPVLLWEFSEQDIRRFR